MSAVRRYFRLDDDDELERKTSAVRLYFRLDKGVTGEEREGLLFPKKREEPAPAKPSRLAQIKQRLEPARKFLAEKREEIGWLRKGLGAEAERVTEKVITRGLEKVGVTPTEVEKLHERYQDTLLGKFDRRFQVAAGRYTKALTGGLLKPQHEASEDLTDKVIGGVAEIAGTVTSFRAIGSIFDGIFKGTTAVTTLINRFPKVAKYGYPLVKNAVIFDVYGQLDPDIQDRFETLAIDTLKSVPYTALGFIPAAKYSVPASFGVGYSMAKLDGATNEDAFISGAILAVLDVFGRITAKDKDFMTGRASDKIVKLEAIETINRYSDVKLSSNPTPDEISTAFKSAAKKAHPDVGGSDAAMRAVNFANEFLVGKKLTLAEVTAPKEARKPGEPPEGLPPTIKKEVTKPKGMVPSETVAKLNESVKTQAAMQIEGIRTGVGGAVPADTSIPEGISELINKVSVSGATNPTEAAELILKALPEPLRTHPEVVDTVTRWGKTQQMSFDKQAVISEAGKIVEGLPETAPKIQEQANEIVKEVARVKTETELLAVEKELLPSLRLAAAKFIEKIAKKAKPKVVPPKEVAPPKEVVPTKVEKKPKEKAIIVAPPAEPAPAPPAVKEVKAPTVKKEIIEIPKDLEPLAKDARKFTTYERWKKMGAELTYLGEFDRKALVDKFGSYEAFWKAATTKEVAKAPPVEVPAEVPKELAPLVAEAKKYEDVEKFVKDFQENWGTKIEKIMDKISKGIEGETARWEAEAPFATSLKAEIERGMTPEAGALKETQIKKWARRDAIEPFLRDFYDLATKEVKAPLEPLYRGSTKSLEESITKEGGLFLTKDVDIAKKFAGKEGTVSTVFADIKKPYDLTKQVLQQPERELLIEAPQHFTEELADLRKEGYDAITYKDQVFVLDPTIVRETAIPKKVKAPTVKKKPAPKEFGLKPLHLKEGKAQRLAAAKIRTKKELQEMSAQEVADLWTKSVGDERIKAKLLEASRKLSISKREKEPLEDWMVRKVEDIIRSLKKEKGSLALTAEDRRQSIEWLRRKDLYDRLTSEQRKFVDSLEKEPLKPKAPPKKKLPAKVKEVKPPSIISGLGLRNPSLPVLKLARVENGKMTFTNLAIEVTLKTDLEDGLYELVGDDFLATKMPLEESPAPLPEVPTIAEIDFETLADIYKKHGKVAREDYRRPILEGTLFEFGENKLRVTSTDGFRMITDAYDVKTTKPVKFVAALTRNHAKVIKVLGGGKVKIGYKKDTKLEKDTSERSIISFDSEFAKVASIAQERDYPKYAKIFPSFGQRHTLDKKALKEALKTIKPYVSHNHFQMVINKEKGTFFVTGSKLLDSGERVRKTVELSTSMEKIKTPKGGVLDGVLLMPIRTTEKTEKERQIETLPKGEAIVITFNQNYVSDALIALDGDTVYFHTIDPYPTKEQVEANEKAVKEGKGWLETDITLTPAHFSDKITEAPKVPGGTALAKGEFSDVKSARKNLDLYKTVQFPELVRLTKQLTGDYPKVNTRLRTALGRATYKILGGAKVELHPDIFKDNEVVAKVLAHELGHIADFFPEGVKARGNLVGRVASLTRYMKRRFGELDDVVLRDELKALTQAWAPFDESLNPNFTKYRYASKELYADAISVLFNDPALLQERAPEFWKGFFEYLDKKPKVKEEFFAIWDLLNKGETVVLSERQKSIREMFDKGEDAFLVAVEEKKLADKDIIFKLRYDLIDRNQKVIDKVNALKKKGVAVSDELNPVYWLEGHNYVGGITKVFMEENIQPVYKGLKDAGLSWEDLGEVLFLERVVHERGAVQNPFDHLWQHADEVSREHYLTPIEKRIEESEGASIRSFSASKQYKLFEKYLTKKEYKDLMEQLPKGIANPLGFGRDTAQPQLEFLQKQLGPEKWKVLTQQLAVFRKAIKSIILEAEKEGFYNKDLIRQMKANPAYATFQVLDYLDINIPASIKHQVGTLKEVSNPASATVFKTVSTIRAIERNKVKKTIIGFMKQHYPTEIESARTIWTGKTHKPVEPRGRERDKKALFTAMIDGKYKGFYVDPYIAKTMEFMGTGQANAMVEVLRFFNSKHFRPLFITFNLGFQSFNLMRDFQRFYVNTPQLSLARAVKRYKQAAGPAFRRAWDIPDETISEMQKEKMLGITYNDIIAGMTSADKQIDFAIAKAGLSPLKATKRRFFIKPFIPLFEVIEKTGNLIETLPKVAGYKELNGKMPRQELASFIRTSVGSPDFLRRGAGYGWYNEVFLFSNAIKEGVRADYNIAFKNPQTRSGFWWKTVKLFFLPTLLMYGALQGLFGKETKKMMEDVSEYDKTNYTIIPLGRKNNQTTYIRIPRTETGRLLGGLFWKALRIFDNRKPILKDVTDLLSYTGGQIPSVTPIVDVVTSTAQFLAGKNPYDFFRGRTVIPDDEFEAGGKYALKPFLTWQLNQVGAGIFFKTYTSTQPVEGKGWVQKTIEAPLLSNIIGRWIKISNYGQREKNKAIVAGERQEAAQRRIEERERVNDAVKEYRTGTQNMTQRLRIERELVKDVVGDAPYKDTRKAKKTNLIKKFHLALIKGESDENINALIYAHSNDEKLALLVRIREDMESADFEALLKRLKQEKIISKTVISDLRKTR